MNDTNVTGIDKDYDVTYCVCTRTTVEHQGFPTLKEAIGYGETLASYLRRTVDVHAETWKLDSFGRERHVMGGHMASCVPNA